MPTGHLPQNAQTRCIPGGDARPQMRTLAPPNSFLI